MKSLLLLGLTGLAANVQAHPHTRPESQVSRRGALDLSKYYLATSSSYSSSQDIKADKIAASLPKRSSYVETATDFVKKTVPEIEFRVVDDHYTGSNGISHVNFKQTVHGIDIDNADFNVNIDREGKIFSFGNGFFTGSVPTQNPLTKRSFAEPVAALKSAISTLNLPIKFDAVETIVAQKESVAEHYTFAKTSGAVSDPKANLVYVVKQDGGLALAWKIETDVMDNWLLTYVDAQDSKTIHAVVDYVTDFTSLQVYPWDLTDPSAGSRKKVTDPWNNNTSPFTWFGDGTNTYTTLSGNNVVVSAKLNDTDYSGPDSPEGKFEYPWSVSSQPEDVVDAALTQVFYTINKYHDLLYTIGFDEAAGNYQTNNNGKGGKENDRIIVVTQDKSTANNAGFSAPADGENGRLRIGLFSSTKPSRDGSLAADVVLHEITHGLSKRLTGGGSNPKCLEGLESGGMGEGWSDFMAVAMQTPKTATRKTVVNFGHWIVGQSGSIRDYPYTTDMKTNPMTYASGGSSPRLYTVGTTWATALNEVMWNLIDKYGNPGSDFPSFDANGVPTDGRFLSMKLVLDGLALQPCGPNAIQARDAILDADKALTGSSNKCEIWKGFAKRGFGTKAAYTTKKRTEDFTLPAGC